MNFEYTILQQVILLLFGGLALFIIAYQAGYNRCFKHHIEEKDSIEKVFDNE